MWVFITSSLGRSFEPQPQTIACGLLDLDQSLPQSGFLTLVTFHLNSLPTGVDNARGSLAPLDDRNVPLRLLFGPDSHHKGKCRRSYLAGGASIAQQFRGACRSVA